MFIMYIPGRQIWTANMLSRVLNAEPNRADTDPQRYVCAFVNIVIKTFQPLQEQVDILISKNQVLQILYHLLLVIRSEKLLLFHIFTSIPKNARSYQLLQAFIGNVQFDTNWIGIPLYIEVLHRSM